jgi:hypothetical protein
MRAGRRRMWQALVVFFAVFSFAASAAQGPPLDRVMRDKLQRSQKILEAVVTSDWSSLEANSRELLRLTEDPRWIVLQYPEYARHSQAFRRAVTDLQAAAAARDLDKAPQAYFAVTLSCIDCHRYVARARVAGAASR